MPVDKRNIVLIGMPTAGKSTVGVMLARQMRYNFTDTDIVIQVTNDATLAEIIERVGNEHFLGIESAAIQTIEPAHTVVATGGSAVYSDEAMESLRKTGPVVYLKLGLGELRRRMGDPKARGVVLKPGQTLADLYDERTPLYERWADVTVDTSGLSQARSVDVVADAVRAWFAEHPVSEPGCASGEPAPSDPTTSPEARG